MSQLFKLYTDKLPASFLPLSIKNRGNDKL